MKKQFFLSYFCIFTTQYDMVEGMNERYDLVASREEITTSITTTAKEILADYPQQSPLFVVLLRGGAPFASRLMFTLTRLQPDYHPELDYLTISTYASGKEAHEPVITSDLTPSTVVTGRDVIIVDDVIDLGVTYDFARQTLLERGARSVKLAVLASKDVPDRIPQADYHSLDGGDKWLVGFGLDDAELTTEGYRWLDEIWEIRR